jgi:DNA polymerase
MVVGESWGAQEEDQKLPFVGGSGQELDRMLAEAGINPAECFFTNVVSARPSGNDMSTFFYSTQEVRSESPFCIRGLYPKPIVENSLRVLAKQIELVNPDFIIGFGNYSLWALTEDSFRVSNATSKVDRKGRKVPTGIASFRGSQLRTRAELGTRPFLPTFHPAAILRQWSWRAPAVHDLRVRYGKFVEGSWNPPERNFLVRPSFSDARNFLRSVEDRLTEGAVPLSVDLETRAGHIACAGFATSASEAI